MEVPNMEKRYATQSILSHKQAESLVSKLIYSIEGITNCYLDSVTHEIVIELTPISDLDTIQNTISIMIEWEKNHRILSHRILKQSDESALVGESNSSGLLSEIDSIYTANGTVRRDFAVSLFELLDRIFVKLALRHQAKLRKYSSMISIKTLEKCRYIPSFPQNIHFVSEIPHQLETLERVKEANNLEDITRLSPFALSPAVCFHCYEELSGYQMNHPVVLTAIGNCYRHEAPWRLGKHRLNEFSMREIVLFGDAKFIESERYSIMEEVWLLFESLGLTGKIETASDLFYFSEDDAKSQHQLMANMKYELIVNINGGRESFSIASFNHMGDTLCKPFKVHHVGDKPMNSGCIAFGIDRWVYALLAKYGIEFNYWPDHVKEVLNELKEEAASLESTF
jgi:hypothetical protein